MAGANRLCGSHVPEVLAFSIVPRNGTLLPVAGAGCGGVAALGRRDHDRAPRHSPPTEACLAVRVSVRHSVSNDHARGGANPKLKSSRDIQPITEFGANAARFIEQVLETGEPIILTQHGQQCCRLTRRRSVRIDNGRVGTPAQCVDGGIAGAAGKRSSHAAVARTLRIRLAKRGSSGRPSPRHARSRRSTASHSSRVY